MAGANVKEKDSEESTMCFSLEEISGSAYVTKDAEMEPFGNQTVSCILKRPVKKSAYFKRVNVALEPLDKHKEGDGQYCSVPSYTYLKPGSHRVQVMIKNITARPIKVQSGNRVANVEAANVVPDMLAPKVDQKLISKSAKVDHEADTQGSSHDAQPRGQTRDPENTKKEVDRTPLSSEQLELLFDKINFVEGTKDWIKQSLF